MKGLQRQRVLLGRAPIFADGLGHAEAAQALHAGEAVEAAVHDAAERQRLAHVGSRKVVDRRHARLAPHAVGIAGSLPLWHALQTWLC